ncbi:MAG: CHAD domain-containing protein [Methylovulum sp.]|nr:CHAD domain-containing protein [Methylovulum sp.]
MPKSPPPLKHSKTLNTTDLHAHTSVNSACIKLYTQQLSLIKATEHGVINDINETFLHEYRIGIRKTRVLLSELKWLLPNTSHLKFSAFFNWLNKITGPKRDIDVFIINLLSLETLLPKALHDEFLPLQAHLVATQQTLHQALKEELQGAAYNTKLAEWEFFLNHELAEQSQLGKNHTLKHTADLTLKKALNRLIIKGDAITSASTPEALHSLRKNCKKLRYLIEFFQTLYSEKKTTNFIQHLKALQDTLGMLHDAHVQREHLLSFSEELIAQHHYKHSLKIIPLLLEILDKQTTKSSLDFSKGYTDFVACADDIKEHYFK